MKPLWDDVNARARGLGTHLFPRGELERFARAGDLAATAVALAGAGAEARATVTAAGLDLAVRRRAAHGLATLARWCGTRVDRLAVLFEDEDRRSLRAILRGAVQGAAPELRIAGCIPTPALPVRALEELARLPGPGPLAALLVAWGNPYGTALLKEASQVHPDLFQLETSLNRTFAARALARSGERALAEFACETIDLENAWSALLLASQGGDVRRGDAFVPGGRWLDRKRFEAAASVEDAATAGRRLAAVFVRTPFGDVFARPGSSAQLENAVLAVRIKKQRREALRDPSGPAPLLAYALRLRAEALDLRRIVWGLALAAPPTALSLQLVTV